MTLGGESMEEISTDFLCRAQFTFTAQFLGNPQIIQGVLYNRVAPPPPEPSFLYFEQSTMAFYCAGISSLNPSYFQVFQQRPYLTEEPPFATHP
jgi:hypothetical protein